MGSEWLLHLPLEESSTSSFNLEKAVCNHGFFMMAPNRWIPSTKTLKRPLRLADHTTSVIVSITQPLENPNSLLVKLHDHYQIPSLEDRRVILEQVRRMLRITEKDDKDLREFQKLHPHAMLNGFGRIFRSASLFEDAIKCILLCNCKWSRTLKMAESLCKLQFEIYNKNVDSTSVVKRKRSTLKAKIVSSNLLSGEIENFPNSKELASLDEKQLQSYELNSILGYRAKHILKFAKDVESGKLQLQQLEVEAVNGSDKKAIEKAHKKLKKIDGFGPFACANLLMCLGYYERIPADTETFRVLQQADERKSMNKKIRHIHREVQEIYQKYAPFQCLAYWLELLVYYENKFGKLSNLPESSYHLISSRLHS